MARSTRGPFVGGGSPHWPPWRSRSARGSWRIGTSGRWGRSPGPFRRWRSRASRRWPAGRPGSGRLGDRGGVRRARRRPGIIIGGRTWRRTTSPGPPGPPASVGRPGSGGCRSRRRHSARGTAGLTTEGSTRTVLALTGINDGRGWRAASGRVQTWIAGDRSDLEPGRPVEAAGVLSTIEGPLNPGEVDFRPILRSRGIRLRLSVDEPSGVWPDPRGVDWPWTRSPGRDPGRSRPDARLGARPVGRPPGLGPAARPPGGG